MKTLKTTLLGLLLAGLALVAAPRAELQIIGPVTATVASGSTTGTAGDIGAAFGRLVGVRCTAADTTGTTYTIKIRDASNVALWSAPSIAENQTSYVTPAQGASSTTAPDWVGGEIVPIMSGTRGPNGLSSSSSTTWDFTITSASTEAGPRTYTLYLIIDTDQWQTN